MRPSSVLQVEKQVVSGKEEIKATTSGRHPDGAAWCAYEPSGTVVAAADAVAARAPPLVVAISSFSCGMESTSTTVVVVLEDDDSSMPFIDSPESCFFRLFSIVASGHTKR